ncbi:acyl-CoA dehydrogenase family protein [Streptomyces sp. TRM49041]|uniref:acyl-CoA dehydrogenase family protein n=1 Tax=Streptomyces sp. TRM49041 TaxID=2603216 RepID=UPI0011EFAFFD|nr:acyl-CoA dehydrogenase family protein [Streptomyces sp. TRM49041]
MRFQPTVEQRDFVRSLNAMLTAADSPSAARAWAAGEPGQGRAVRARLAVAGVFALAVPEAYEGVGVHPVEVALACEEVGRHAVPGPVVETVAAAELLTRLAELGDDAPAKRLLPGIASGEVTATLAAPETGGYALDADVADVVLVVGGERGDELRVAPGHGPVRASADPVRRLARPAPGGELLAAGDRVARAGRCAAERAALATAAQSLGVGCALLDRTVAYVRQRHQFGVPVGSFQAVKHRLADALLGLEFARPLVWGAALTLRTADVAAAKVAAGEAAYVAARTALQLHGAIGYTDELDLALWLRKARPLRDAWGTPAWCRQQVLRAAVPAGD